MMATCKGCGHDEPEDILEAGFCPGCADDCLCDEPASVRAVLQPMRRL